MKRLRLVILAAVAAVMLLAFPAAAFADHLNGASNWEVTFTSDAKMSDNYSGKEFADAIGKLEPGDDITFTVNLHHKHGTACDWYMANEVLKTLEEGRATGSAYGYKLSYFNPKGVERVLYDSETVGGTDSEGLFEATNALDDYFYLDNLANGQDAQVKLVVTLDGETEGNAYFDKLARLQMKFAVELPTKDSNTTRGNDVSRNIVKTGDDMVELMPFFVAMIVSGALFLGLAVYSVRLRRRA